MGRQVFLQCLATGRRKLIHDPKFMSARRRAELGLDILAEPPAIDNDLGAGSVGPRDAGVVRSEAQSKHTCWLMKQQSSAQEGVSKAKPFLHRRMDVARALCVL